MDIDALRALHAEGLTCAEIGVRLGRHRSNVHAAVKRLGLTPHQKRTGRPKKKAGVVVPAQLAARARELGVDPIEALESALKLRE